MDMGTYGERLDIVACIIGMVKQAVCNGQDVS